MPLPLLWKLKQEMSFHTLVMQGPKCMVIMVRMLILLQAEEVPEVF